MLECIYTERAIQSAAREGRVPRCAAAPRNRRASTDSWRVTDARADVALTATERTANRAETLWSGVCTSYKYHRWVELGEDLVLITFSRTVESGSESLHSTALIWSPQSHLVPHNLSSSHRPSFSSLFETGTVRIITSLLSVFPILRTLL